MGSRRRGPEALLGTELARRYRVVQHLGSGGMAHVYLAHRIGVEREERVALKVLRAEHVGAVALAARFEREARAAAASRHPNVLEVGELERTAEGVPFFSMELLVGLDLADALAYARSLAPGRAVRIASAVARGLSAAHVHGVVHRDIKPENVFLVHAADGRELVKVVDFGLAWMRGDRRAAESAASRGLVVGTPEYMAPEQARGAPASPTADVYSLGIVLFEMLTGALPFTGAYPDIADRHAEEPAPSLAEAAPDLDASPELEQLLATALAKAPVGRFPDGAALAAALERLPEGNPR